jgi:hypothetical protein
MPAVQERPAKSHNMSGNEIKINYSGGFKWEHRLKSADILTHIMRA